MKNLSAPSPYKKYYDMVVMYKSEQEFLRKNGKKITYYLKKIGLGYDTPFTDLDLLLYARIVFPKRENSKNVIKINKLLDGLSIHSMDAMEFIGDAILHMITTNYVSRELRPVGVMHNMRVAIEQNTKLAQYGTSLEICKNVIPKTEYKKGTKPYSPSEKSCADTLEALIGALYLDLFYNKNLRYAAIDYVEDWLHTINPQEMPRY